MILPLILLPGMMCDARLFAPQITALSHIAITVEKITEYDTIYSLASDILQHAPSEFALAGLSMGGIVAMEIVRQAPERVQRLALLDTNPLAENDATKQKREPQIIKVQQGKLLEVMRDEMKPNYLAKTAHYQEILDLCMAMALDLGADIFIRQSRALQNRPDQCETLRKYQGKTLILHGASDTLCPAERHELMHQTMPNSSYHIIEHAGHLPTLEQPQRTNHLLRSWLE